MLLTDLQSLVDSTQYTHIYTYIRSSSSSLQATPECALLLSEVWSGMIICSVCYMYPLCIHVHCIDMYTYESAVYTCVLRAAYICIHMYEGFMHVCSMYV